MVTTYLYVYFHILCTKFSIVTNEYQFEIFIMTSYHCKKFIGNMVDISSSYVKRFRQE